jgi:methylated-DNA-[protein]-cysteine S-methyltransferase
MTEVTAKIYVPTPWGRDLALTANGDAIIAAAFVAKRVRRPSASDPLLREAAAQVRAYFARRLRAFDVPLAPDGTPFARAVYALAAQLRFGEFVSYADVARAAGRPLAHRGVALAMRRSPIDLLIPAHRVVGSDGRVRGARPGSIRLRLVAFERAKPQR